MTSWKILEHVWGLFKKGLDPRISLASGGISVVLPSLPSLFMSQPIIMWLGHLLLKGEFMCYLSFQLEFL